MKEYLLSTPFERLLNHHLISVNEVSLAIFSVHPNIKTQDIPVEIQDEVKDVRKAMVRNIRAASASDISTNTDIPADFVFGAAFQFVIPDLTPQPIINRAKEAIESLTHTNSWESTIYCLGGRALVEECRLLRKSGRGKHRKDDERKNTDKILWLLVNLLAAKQSTGKYGTINSPSISEIYSDIKQLADAAGMNMNGVGKSSFYEKIKRARVAFFDE